MLGKVVLDRLKCVGGVQRGVVHGGGVTVESIYLYNGNRSFV